MVKIEICKNVSFSTGKNWLFRRKSPKGATFTVYNTTIPICKCKDAFLSKSGLKHLFSISLQLLCDVNKKTPRGSRYIHQMTQHARAGRRSPESPGGAGKRRVSMGGRSPTGQNTYKLPKKGAGICVNFQHNTALYSIYKYGMIASRNRGPGGRISAVFSRFPKFLHTFYERGMQLWQIWI